MNDTGRNSNVLQNVTAAIKGFDFQKHEAKAVPVKPVRICERCQRSEAYDRMSLCLSCSYC